MSSNAIQLFAQAPDAILAKADELGLSIPDIDRRLLHSQGASVIRELDPKDLMAQVVGLLHGIFRNLGIHSEPDQADAAQFYKTIRERFAGLTTLDVLNAFELYVYHDLDKYLPTDKDGTPIKHYQKFSMTFYVEVLRAYQSRKGEAKRMLADRTDVKLLSLHAEAQDPHDVRCGMLEILKGIVMAVANRETPLFAVTLTAEEALQDVKLLPDPIEVTEEDVSAAKEALTRNRGRSVARAIEGALKAGLMPDDLKARARTVATHRLLRDAAQSIGPDKVAERFDWLITTYKRAKERAKS